MDNDDFEDWESDEYSFEEQLERIDNDLRDEEILIFIDLVFDDPDDAQSFSNDKTWWPNRRAVEILDGLSPKTIVGKGQSALAILAFLLRDQTEGDFSKAKKILRGCGFDIPFEGEPDQVVEVKIERVVATTEDSLLSKIKARQKLLFVQNMKPPKINATSKDGHGHESSSTIEAAYFETRDVDFIMAELAQMEGMRSVVTWAENLIATEHTVKLRSAIGIARSNDMPRHLVFRGAPGTGKTTSARLLAELYAALGIVKQNKFIETDRRGLVGLYIGHTAERTAQTIQQAMGGVLFIDEAYSLNSEGSDFGQEAVATLVQMMETYRNEFAVFFAGYSREMDEFISMNPGLASRISGYLDFEMYTNDELWKVLNRMAIMKSYMIAEDARAVADIWFDNERSKIEFGNARSARRLLDEMVARHARRIHHMDHCTEDDLVLLLADDAVNSDSTNGSGAVR